MKLAGTFGLLLVILMAGAVESSAQQAESTSQPPVFINLRGVDGKNYDIADMRGQVVLVSFGATWCQPCNAELEALEQLKQEYKGRPVRFFWVSVERKNQISDEELRGFAKQHKLSFTVLRDPTQLTYAQFSMRVRLPLVVFFDKDGNLVERRHFGMSTPDRYKDTMRSQIDQLLGSPSPDAGGGL
jgi:thiol-disulfide isomerase/thioredoxin